MPSELPMAPQIELPITVTLDSVVTKCSPRIGSQPVRYGAQVPVMITPALRACSRNSAFFSKNAPLWVKG